MTAPKSTLRTRRRVTPAGKIPDDLAAWFAGELESPPWSALLSPGYELLPGRWQIWKALHPAARPPAGYEWLDEISTNPKGKTSCPI